MGDFICFVELDELISNLMRKCKGPRAKTHLKSNNVGGLALPDIRTYYKSVMIKTVYD